MHSQVLGIVTMLAVALYLILPLIDSAELPMACSWWTIWHYSYVCSDPSKVYTVCKHGIKNNAIWDVGHAVFIPWVIVECQKVYLNWHQLVKTDYLLGLKAFCRKDALLWSWFLTNKYIFYNFLWWNLYNVQCTCRYVQKSNQANKEGEKREGEVSGDGS